METPLSPCRRDAGPRFAILGALAAILLAGSGPAGAALTATGVSAVAGVEPGVAAELTASPQGTPRDLRLDIMFRRPAETNALKRYESIGGAEMRATIVSDDLQHYFYREVSHVIDGHGQLRIRFPDAAFYHVYLEATPRTLPRQILRFDLAVDDPPPSPPRRLGAPVAETHSGPYTLRFDTLDLAAGVPHQVTLSITEAGRPAGHLHPIEPGIAIRSFLVAAADLDMVPLVPPAGPTDGAGGIPADLPLDIPALRAGFYRLFVAFSDGRFAFTAPFTLRAADPPK